MKRSHFRYSCAALLILGAAFAQGAPAVDFSGLFLGGNYGRAYNGYDTSTIDSAFQSSAASAGDTLSKSSGHVQRGLNAWWFNAGYWFLPNFGVDAAYLHLGSWNYNAVGTLKTLAGNEPITTGAAVTSRGPALSLLARLPLTESFEVDARVGDYYGRTSLNTFFNLNSQYTATPASASSSSLLLGVGGGFTFAGHWCIRVDYLRINQAGTGNTGKYSVNFPSAGVTYTF